MLRGNTVAELIDLTLPLCTTAKHDFCGRYATVSVQHNAKLPCSHLLSNRFVDILTAN